jgi:hypothetical protein
VNVSTYFGSVLIAFTLIAATTGDCAAQQIGSIDLTSTNQSRSLQRPAELDEGRVSHASASESHEESCNQAPATTATLQTTLLSLDRTIYVVGDEPRFVVRIKNVGTRSTKIPFSSDLASLQPADPSSKFTYFTIVTDLWIGGKKWKANTGGTITLYGVEDLSESMVILHPGEWVQVVGKGRIELSKDFPSLVRSGDVVSQANAKSAIFRNELILTAKADALVSTRLCLFEKQGSAVAMNLAEN